MFASPKSDFGTLDTDRIVRDGLVEVGLASDEAARAARTADLILRTFDDYYGRSRLIPHLAKRAFETRAWKTSVELSQERIAIYSVAVNKLAGHLEASGLAARPLATFWTAVDARFEALVGARYEADLAMAWLASLRRLIHRETWQPDRVKLPPTPRAPASFVRVLPCEARMTPALVETLLRQPRIVGRYRDLQDDALRAAERINERLDIGPTQPLEKVEVITEGFFRNRGAYVVGALTVAGARSPLALALLNREDGLELDAVILRQSTLSHVFSSTLANFHVAIPEYHELVDYLHGLNPIRPRGQHYSTIGYNHVGKVAVMRQTRAILEGEGEALGHAPGPRGSVAVAFTAPNVPFVLKVIRDTPTENYKWERYGGKEEVLAKYGRVHELNRSGSMLDNIIYNNTVLPRGYFGDDLLDELCCACGSSVRLLARDVFFDHLVVQRRLTPLPIYLEACTPAEAERVVIRLGQCIRNNAATNVFNRDLDGRNYGVSSLGFVYLFDYDALEYLTDVDVETNADREPGEEDPPDWFFGGRLVFLPEELELHLRLPGRALKRLFREAHGELLTAAYWRRMQAWLREGRVPRVRTYPRSSQLRHRDDGSWPMQMAPL
jgi:isocitrate dehydrogenase kinase/phosphatase